MTAHMYSESEGNAHNHGCGWKPLRIISKVFGRIYRSTLQRGISEGCLSGYSTCFVETVHLIK